MAAFTTSPDPDSFIARWRESGAAERANYQLFLSELCDLLGVDRPQPATADTAADAYVFEKPVPLPHGTTGFIDLYRRGRFVLEAKQGSDPVAAGEADGRARRGTAVRGTASWDTALEKARRQAQTYARSLPPAELVDGGRPPFLIVVDVGNTIELYSEFTRSGGNYVPFPDPHSYRLPLDALRDEATRERLRAVWTDPLSLDPARRSTRVTRAIARQLADLAKSLEHDHAPEPVAHFLMRCLFTMFAEDVGLLPERAFTNLLNDLLNDPGSFKPMVEHLWGTMNTGGFSVVLRQTIPRFNGGLFADQEALPLDAEQIGLLIEAARADWRDVEPAIFGTLLERALNPIERHQLGAHFTPRAYVERLVLPTVVEPLRAEWEGVQAAAAQLADAGDERKAIAEVAAFHRRLAATRVLDPACGSGNFLYVTLEHLKRLEGEVLNMLRDLGHGQLSLAIESVMVTPQQLLGIEVNPRAAAIAELVLWIGYLQWHLRTRGDVPVAEPIIRDFHNIERRDAVLEWDAVEPLLDAGGQPVTRWDGRTTKRHPVTGEQVPDETARVPVYRYLNPRPATWPAAEFVVGNPPFIANRNLRAELSEGYVDALNIAFADIREAADFVMYFWFLAAEKVISKTIRRFGLITTNSIRMLQNQGVVRRAVDKGARIVFAIPDHPWPSESDDAKVRVSMTVVGHKDREVGPAVLVLASGHDEVATIRGREITAEDYSVLIRTEIPADLSPSTDTTGVVELKSWNYLCHAGMKPYSQKLIITKSDALRLFKSEEDMRLHAPPYRNGSDIARYPRGVHVIDFFGKTIEEIRLQYPDAYQYLLIYVKPERAAVRNPRLRDEWWLFEANRPQLRAALISLGRYIVTVENSPQRYFVFLDSELLPDQKLRVIASDDAYLLGVLSSTIHTIYAFRVGGRQGVANTPVYNTRCCTTFPFPDPTPAQRERIRELGEQLDAHRKRQQARHPRLTLTDMYNVLAKLRAGEPLTDADRRIHEQGLVSVLRQIHDELDAAVLEAYGWPSALDDDDILERLVALNAERAAEEARGVVRWLRPEYQARDAAPAATQSTLLEERTAAASPAEAPPWPGELAAQATAVRAMLVALARPVTADEVAAAFAGKATKARREQVSELLQTLGALGQAREAGDGRWGEG